MRSGGGRVLVAISATLLVTVTLLATARSVPLALVRSVGGGSRRGNPPRGPLLVKSDGGGGRTTTGLVAPAGFTTLAPSMVSTNVTLSCDQYSRSVRSAT